MRSSHLLGDSRASLISSTVLLRIEFTAPRCLHAAGELLPRLSTLTLQRQGGIFLLHFSWGHPRRALPVILALWSPDFPHGRRVGASRAAVRPGCKVYCSGLLRKCQSLLQICLGKAIIKIIILRADTCCAKNQMAGAEARPAEGKDTGMTVRRIFCGAAGQARRCAGPGRQQSAADAAAAGAMAAPSPAVTKRRWSTCRRRCRRACRPGRSLADLGPGYLDGTDGGCRFPDAGDAPGYPGAAGAAPGGRGHHLGDGGILRRLPGKAHRRDRLRRQNDDRDAYFRAFEAGRAQRSGWGAISARRCCSTPSRCSTEDFAVVELSSFQLMGIPLQRTCGSRDESRAEPSGYP